MWVEMGNTVAMQFDQGSSRVLPGQRVTRFDFPQEMGETEALRIVTTSWPAMTGTDDKGKTPKPVWIESDVRNLRTQLCKRYGIKVKDAKRPGDWGSPLAIAAALRGAESS